MLNSILNMLNKEQHPETGDATKFHSSSGAEIVKKD